jgi:broad specificity phosphatase PhoE
MSERTIVHLMRHGEVHNPQGVLYGRLPEFYLSDLGHQMAERAADHLSTNEIVHLVSSPLERAQQTVAPLAKLLEAPVTTDDRVIEADNLFEGRTVGAEPKALLHPKNWWLLRNPFRPSWGEPYREIAARMQAAVIVSHQLPVWIARQAYEKKSFVHDPRTRQCSLASLTSLTFDGDRYVGFTYAEPAGDLLPDALKAGKKFVGGA